MGGTETREEPTHALQGTEVRSPCLACGQDTMHVVSASTEVRSEYVDGSFSVEGSDEYMVVECRGCQSIRFRHVHTDSENLYPDPESGVWHAIPAIKLYPPYNESRGQVHHAEFLPTPVGLIYRETLNALNAGLPVLAGVGLRALVETICRHQQASGRNLEKRIDSLVAQGAVSEAGSEILHGLRIMGNQAAHEVTPHSAEDLHVALDVVEHTLQGIYILPREAAALPRRSTKGSEESSGPAT